MLGTMSGLQGAISVGECGYVVEWTVLQSQGFEDKCKSFIECRGFQSSCKALETCGNGVLQDLHRLIISATQIDADPEQIGEAMQMVLGTFIWTPSLRTLLLSQPARPESLLHALVCTTVGYNRARAYDDDDDDGDHVIADSEESNPDDETMIDHADAEVPCELVEVAALAYWVYVLNVTIRDFNLALKDVRRQSSLSALPSPQSSIVSGLICALPLPVQAMATALLEPSFAPWKHEDGIFRQYNSRCWSLGVPCHTAVNKVEYPEADRETAHYYYRAVLAVFRGGDKSPKLASMVAHVERFLDAYTWGQSNLLGPVYGCKGR